MSDKPLSALPVHPAADVFPMLDDDQFRDFAANIAEHGLKIPVTLWMDPERGPVLIDGRNRLKACQMLGREADVSYYEGDDPVGEILSLNLRRRHLTASQRATIAVDLEPHFAAQAAKRRGGRPPKKPRANWPEVSQRPSDVRDTASNPRARDQAAAAVGVSGRTVQRAKHVAAEAPDLLEKVKEGEMSIHAAEQEVIARNGGSKPKRPQAREPRPAKHLRGTRPLDPNDVVDNVVVYLQGLNSVLDECAVTIDGLDPDRVHGWVASIETTVKKINRFKRGLNSHAVH